MQWAKLKKMCLVQKRDEPLKNTGYRNKTSGPKLLLIRLIFLTEIQFLLVDKQHFTIFWQAPHFIVNEQL